jgi:hypothetical protein
MSRVPRRLYPQETPKPAAEKPGRGAGKPLSPRDDPLDLPGARIWDDLPRIQGDGIMLRTVLLHAVQDRITWQDEFAQA